MQGVIKAFDPVTKLGSLIREPDLAEVDFVYSPSETSIFRFLRQGQRVNFDLDDDGLAINLRFGSELDMQTYKPEP